MAAPSTASIAQNIANATAKPQDPGRTNNNLRNEVEEEKRKPQRDEPVKIAWWVTRDIAEEFGREAVLVTTLRAALFYAVFFIAVTLCITLRTHSRRFFFAEAIKGQFLETQFNTINEETIEFSDIKTATDFWNFAETVLMDSLFCDYYYDDENFPITDADDRKILHENILVGVPRIRQVKVKNDSCNIHQYFRLLFHTCYDMYLPKDEDHSSFGKMKGTAWVYNTEEETGSIPFTGQVATYAGGGFYQDLSSDKEQSLEIIKELRENMWITRGTRVVFIDFTIYNGNMNLFCLCKMIFEFPPTGGVLTSDNFMVVYLDVGFKSNDYVAILSECLIYAMGIFYLFEELREIWFLKWRYFLMFWTYTDLLLIALVLANLFTSVILFPDVYAILDARIENSDEYGNLEEVGTLKSSNNRICAILQFFAFIKCFKYLNMNRTLGQLNNTLKTCVYDIVCFTIMFMIIFSAYAELGYLLFGSQVVDYSSFGTAMVSLLRCILGDFDYQSIEKANRILAPIYFLSYIFLVFFVLLNMFLAIINDKYCDVKTEIAIAPSELQMTEYLKRGFMNFMKKCGCNWDPSKMSEVKIINQIQSSLKKCGFTQAEIDLFFSKMNPNNRFDTNQLVKELESQANAISNVDDTVFVQLIDFQIHERRLNDIETRLENLIKEFDEPMSRLDALEKKESSNSAVSRRI